MNGRFETFTWICCLFLWRKVYAGKSEVDMFTAGADVLGCYESDRLWFLLKGRNQSLFSFAYQHISGFMLSTYEY